VARNEKRGDTRHAIYAENLAKYQKLTDYQQRWLSNRPLHKQDKQCCEEMGLSYLTLMHWREKDGFKELDRWFLEDPARVAIARRDLLLFLAEQECEKILREGTGQQKIQAINWASRFHNDTAAFVKQRKGPIVKWSPKMEADAKDE